MRLVRWIALTYWMCAAAGATDKDVLALMPKLMESAQAPGAAIAVIRGGRIVQDESFGVRSVATGVKVDKATVFEAASLSKPVFAYAVLKLAGDGWIELDKPLQEYLSGHIKDDHRAVGLTARHVIYVQRFVMWSNGTVRRSGRVQRATPLHIT